MKNKIKILSYNLRYDNPSDNENSFQNRKKIILNKILSENPDVIGFQEILPHMRLWLVDNLNEYNIVGCGRGSDFKGEYNVVAYKKNKFELFGLNIFWLSPTPFVPGSRYEVQSDCPRICTVVTLKHNESDIPFRVYNTHLDHISEEARVNGMSQILAQIEKDNNNVSYPIILMGDFNATPDELALKMVNDFTSYPLVDITSHLDTTFHDYGRMTKLNKIDYIITDKNTESESALTWKDCTNGIYLSDHYPVCTYVSI